MWGPKNVTNLVCKHPHFDPLLSASGSVYCKAIRKIGSKKSEIFTIKGFV